MWKEVFICNNSKESEEIQLKLFKDGHNWWSDGSTSEIMLKSINDYPIFIISDENKILSWIDQAQIKIYHPKEYRKIKLKKLNNGRL